MALVAVLIWAGFWGAIAWWHTIHGEFLGLGFTLVLIALPMAGLAWHFGLGAGSGKRLSGVLKGRKVGR